MRGSRSSVSSVFGLALPSAFVRQLSGSPISEEQEAQRRQLKASGHCKSLQGWLLAPPCERSVSPVNLRFPNEPSLVAPI
jgi:hypothetical protein